MRQETFEFGEFLEKKKPQPPKGYQGLSGFHKYWGKKPIEAYEFLIFEVLVFFQKTKTSKPI
jgi:predicted acetyltransferase